jgi:hypothetical protein
VLRMRQTPKPLPMKVFIQDSRTTEFYAGGGRWVNARADARNWGTGLGAQELTLRENLYSVYILLTSNPESQTITVPFNRSTLFADPNTFRKVGALAEASQSEAPLHNQCALIGNVSGFSSPTI